MNLLARFILRLGAVLAPAQPQLKPIPVPVRRPQTRR
jgi:hypothetical protein